LGYRSAKLYYSTVKIYTRLKKTACRYYKKLEDSLKVAKLSDLGFSKNLIVETIVSTFNFDGTPNAAPMGAIMENEQTLALNIFNTSETNRNIKCTKCAAINIINDIEVFYKTAFKQKKTRGNLPQVWFSKSEMINAPLLSCASATIEVSIINQLFFEEKTRFICQVESINSVKVYPRIYCRAFGVCIEAIVHATRVQDFIGDSNKEEQVSKLLVLIGDCNDVVNRVAPNSIYSAVMSDLLEQVDSWRREK